jgi:hypothetical protein
MRRTALLAVPIALAVSACGAAPARQDNKFKNGDQAQIAKLVDDLANAGRRKDELKSAGGNCVDEMDRAIKDANDYDLQVDDVKVTGSTATARVRQGTSKRVTTFSFVKEKGGWRATALGS